MAKFIKTMIEKNKHSLDQINQLLWSRAYSYSLDIALENNLFKTINEHDGLTLELISTLNELPRRKHTRYQIRKPFFISTQASGN